ncbi:MAG TPA: four-carbon acid sugar kinase family protein [Pseudomonadales bacterium]|nr:four-carbon acid sugar kinase family protein [Pseudomonadales bacterium]
MSQLLIAFYGDDFTGSTDALEQLTLAGIRAALFIEPPTPARLKQFPNLQAIGVAGITRAMAPGAMKRELQTALKKLKKLGARHVHYKVCSTFDSSLEIGSIGCVIDIATKIFRAPFVPLLVAAPALGRFTIFGTHFARYGIGSKGAVYRLDRHPSISKHPVTPMTEADLRLHLARQTKKKIALFDILKMMLPEEQARTEFSNLLRDKPDVVLFDALRAEHLQTIGRLIDPFATAKRPLFSVGSSGIEMALAGLWGKRKATGHKADPAKQILIGSGSCSPVTLEQISWALKRGFAGVSLDAGQLADSKTRAKALGRAMNSAIKLLRDGRSVILFTCKTGPDKRITSKFKNRTAQILGASLGRVLREILAQSSVRRICIAGGDTSSYAARAMGIEALEMIAPLTPGAPLCLAHAPGSPVDGHEIIFKGGQVGGENYFEIVKRGRV